MIAYLGVFIALIIAIVSLIIFSILSAGDDACHDFGLKYYWSSDYCYKDYGNGTVLRYEVRDMGFFDFRVNKNPTHYEFFQKEND